MNTYKLDYPTNNSLETLPGVGRSLLQVYTGSSISENEAKTLLRKIADHKWYVSQKLDRDIGFHVAAIDYVENFYEPRTVESPLRTFVTKTGKAVRSAFRKYLKAKGGTMSV